jgi:hypothetical protein
MEACPRAHRTADVSRGATAHGRTAPQASMVDPRSRICGCRTTSRCAWSVHRWRRRWGRTRDQGMSSMLGAAYEPGIFSSLGGYADQPHHHITRSHIPSLRSVMQTRRSVGSWAPRRLRAHGAPPRAGSGPGPDHTLAQGGRGAGGRAHTGRDLWAAAQTPCRGSRTIRVKFQMGLLTQRYAGIQRREV